MKVFENKQLIIDFDSALSLIKVTRLSSEEIDEEQYKLLLHSWIKEIEFYKPKFQIINYTNYYKPIPTHLKKWINENLIAPAFNAGMQKIAIIISRDLYVQISIEQTLIENKVKNFEIRYFANEIDAEHWLFEEEGLSNS